MGKKTDSRIPDDVYIQFVRSLFDNAPMLLVGAACHSIIAYMVYWENGSPIFLITAAVLLAIGIWRYSDLRRFARSGGLTDAASAWAWERSYLVKGSIQGFALGTFCFIAIGSSDPYAAIGAISVTLGSIVTVVGRNYGSPRMVAIFATTFVAPIATGLILRLDLPHVVLGLLIIPFFFIIKASADNVRSVLFSAVIGHKQARQIAHRFDRALNTMPHGLVMLDPEGQVVVANAEAAHLLAMSSPDAIMGRSIEALFRRAVARGCSTATSAGTRSPRSRGRCVTGATARCSSASPTVAISSSPRAKATTTSA